MTKTFISDGKEYNSEQEYEILKAEEELRRGNGKY
jgi:hypothetical protein